VENTLFKVPKNHFTTSSIFATIFTLPSGEKDVEGTEERPFTLHGISAVHFECLLKVMYPMMPLTELKLTRQEWCSVLKLSTMWEFTKIRKWAIDKLSEMKAEMGEIEMIEFGTSFDVKEWRLEGYDSLLKRGKTITDEEAERLGWKIAAKLLRLRERFASTLIGTLAVGEACTLCNQTGRAVPGQNSSQCSRCCGLGVGVAGIISRYQNAVSRIREGHTEAVEKEFQMEH
ncbi:hypothetical protein PILCRDRAFT_69082, partial [Piloderma croceum F 1598]